MGGEREVKPPISKEEIHELKTWLRADIIETIKKDLEEQTKGDGCYELIDIERLQNYLEIVFKSSENTVTTIWVPYSRTKIVETIIYYHDVDTEFEVARIRRVIIYPHECVQEIIIDPMPIVNDMINDLLRENTETQ